MIQNSSKSALAKLPSLHLFAEDDSRQDPFYDIEFVKRFHHLRPVESNGSNSGCWRISINPNRRSADFNILRERVVSLNKGRECNLVLFNSPTQAGIAPKLMLEFVWETSKNEKDEILMIDCNFRTPNLNYIYELSPGIGLAEYITGTHTIQEVIRKTNIGKVHLLRSGQASLDPVDLLLSERFIDLIDSLKSRFDFILFNSPPYRDFVDAFALAKFIRPTVLLTLLSAKENWALTQDIRDELAVLDLDIVGIISCQGCAVRD